MDFASILQGVMGVGVALAGGAVGNTAGKSSKVGGDKPWNKLLAPAGAMAVATVYHGFTGDSSTAQDIAVGGAVLGVTATGIHSVVKNIDQLIKLF